MKTIEQMITEDQISIAWENADFGRFYNNNKRLVINNALLKFAAGYSNGHTAQCIIVSLGLVNSKTAKLTNIGKEYLYSAFVTEADF